jgi:lipoprotein-anchoring transpeptidase ErfK/SrfK
MYLVEDYEVIKEFPASTGQYGAATALGEFQVYEKLGTVWGIYNIWMPYWMTIYYVGDVKNGIHGIPIGADGVRWSSWEQRIGVIPTTVGCVMPTDKNAKIVYDWADVGTPVSIVW